MLDFIRSNHCDMYRCIRVAQVWSLLSGSLMQTVQGSNQDEGEDGAGMEHEPCYALAVAPAAAGAEQVLVSVDAGGKLSVWDLRSVLRDILWSRRKHFVMFLSGSGILRGEEESNNNSNDIPESNYSGFNGHNHFRSNANQIHAQTQVQGRTEGESNGVASSELVSNITVAGSNSSVQPSPASIMEVFSSVSLCYEIAAFL